MIRFIVALAVLSFATACQRQPGNETQTASQTDASAATSDVVTVTLTAADGVKVFGSYYPVARPKALILLFHQAGSSAAEYATIAPRLNSMGYSALAIDQRSGGTMFGRNRTVDALGMAQDFSAARKDLEAALAWAQAKRKPILLWGSSYSAALVFLVAATHSDIEALLAFSPGEYLGDKHAVETAAAKLDIPVFITCAPTEEETGLAKPIADAVPTKFLQFYVPMAGVHGSSTLIARHDPAGEEENWKHVEAFLTRVAQ